MTRKILVTGAKGRVGSAFVKYIDDNQLNFDLNLGDLIAKEERDIALDVTDLLSCKRACEGVHTVVHLAGVASPDSSFEQVLNINMVGTQNIFQAALEAGVKRVVFASSAQTIEGYPLDVQVNENMPVRPKNLYGVSKVFGEALGSYYAYQKQLEVVVIRIGAFEYAHEWKKLGFRDMSAWAEPEDICSLIHRSIETKLQDSPFIIVHGISDNRFKRLDLERTKSLLGYKPKGDSFKVWHMGLDEESEPRSDS